MKHLALTLGFAGLVLAGCASAPKVEPVRFESDVDLLSEQELVRRVEEAAKTLYADTNLRLVLIGHADEDNTDAYNVALSERRGNHVRDLMVAAHPSLASRIEVEGRGEHDPVSRDASEEAKAKNRRVEFVFYYPRRCAPDFTAEFLECQVGRVDLTDRPEPVEPTPEPPEPEPESEPVEPPAPPPLRFIGPYALVDQGLGVTSGATVRQHYLWGVGAGYLWAPNRLLRLSAGGRFDHLLDTGFLFESESACPDDATCDPIDRSALRITPEFRIGAATDRFWAYVRLFAGIALLHREGRTTTAPGPDGMLEDVRTAARWRGDGNYGLGPGFAVRIWRGLTLGFDAGVSFTGRVGAGTGIFSGSANLGWYFGRSVTQRRR